MIKNKIRKIKASFYTKTDDKQRVVVKGLMFVLAISLLTYLIVLNTGIFTPGYSKPFFNWLHTPGGTIFLASYLVLLSVLILLSVKKTNRLIGKSVKKVSSPLSSKYSLGYSTDALEGRKKRIKTLMWVVIVLTPLVVFTLVNQGYAQAGWWNDNWSYRKKVTITNSGSQQTDYQVYINLNTSTLVSAGKMRSDCADIRLTEFPTNSPITDQYYVEGCNSTSTNIWIKMATVPTTDTLLYLYYGNNNASSLETDANEVFIAYDDFNDGTIDSRWTQHGDTGPWSETGGYLRVTDTDNDAYSYMYFNSQTRSNTDYFVIDTRMRFNSSSIWGSIQIFDTGSSTHHIDFNPNRYDDRATALALEQPEVPTVNNDGTWYTVKVTYDGGTGTMTLFHNGTSAYVDSTTGSEGSSSGYFGVGSNYAAGSTDWDYFRVRKYAATEPSAALASEEVGPQPLAYWKFNEGYGQVANDSSTNGSDAQLGATSGSEASDPSWKTEDECFSGTCLDYDGSDDYVDTNKDYSWSTSDSFSMSAWINVDSSGNHVIIGKGYTTDWEYRFYVQGLTPGFLNWDTGGSGDLGMVSSTPITANKWHHVVVTYNGSVGYIYVDGEQTGSDATITGPFQDRSVDTKIGEGYWNSGVGARFTGKIDEVKIYPYARSADEIKTDYLNGAAIHGSAAVLGRTDNSKLLDGLVTYWKMDETSANSCDDTNDACDDTGNLNHARWEDNATTTGGKFASGVTFDGTNDRVATSSANGVPGGSDTPAGWFNNRWYARRKVTFDNSDSTEDLDDFPVLIKLNSSRIDYTKTQNSGQDIRFTDSDGTTQLAHEIEKWDEAGTSWVWVKVPQIPSTSTTDYIWMYYDNADAADGQDITNVWNDNYVAVLHTDETTGTILYDSTSWGSNGTKKAATEPNPNSSGKVDGTQYFDGGNDYAHLGHPDQLDFTTGLTASIWIYPQDTTSDWDRVLHKPWTSDASPWNTWVIQRTASAQTYTFGVTISGPGSRSAGTSSSAPLNDWTHLTGTYNGQVAKMYFDGDEEGSNDYGSQANILTNSLNLQLGRNYYNREYVRGRYDELRLSNIARTGEWVEAEYKTMEDTFVSSYSGEEKQSNPITIAAWVKADTLGATDRVIIARNNSGSYSWAIYNDSSNPGKLAFTSDGETNTGVSVTTLSTGTWYHVAMTADKVKTKLYINGILDNEITHNGTLPGTGDISAGADPDGTDGWDGKIDDVRIYDRTVPGNEINQLFRWSPSAVAHWKMDETSWTNDCSTDTMFDISGNEYHGDSCPNTTGPTGGVEGKYGYGGYFDGSDDYVTIGNQVYSADTGSVSFWLKKSGDATGTDIVIGSYGGSGNQRAPTIYAPGAGASTLQWEFGSLTSQNSGATINLDTWYHVALTYDDAFNVKVYLDGVEVDSATSGDPGDFYDAIHIGHYANFGSNYFNGYVDELKIYDYARTADQVVQDYNSGHPAPGSPVGSPIMHWRFDEGYGDTANDNSPQGNNGDLGDSGQTCPAGVNTSCPSWSKDGKIGGALDFDISGTTDDYVDAPDFFYSDEMTLCTWVYGRTLDANARTVVVKRNTSGINDTGSDEEWGMWVSSGVPRFAVWDSGSTGYSAISSTSISTNTWHHICGVSNGAGSTVNIYIDGKETGSASQTNARRNSSAPIQAGVRTANDNNRYWDGLMDEVKIYNFALNSTQINQEMNGGKSVVWGASSTDSSGIANRSTERKYCVPGDSTSCSAPVAEWKFDEGVGTTANDTSENTNTGALNNSPPWKSLGECKDGKCLQFNGTNQFVNVPTRSNLDITTFSIEGWIKMNDVTETDQFIFWNAKSSTAWGGWGLAINRDNILGCDAGEICLWISENSGANYDYVEVAHNITENNRWYHVAATWNNSTKTASYYVDGYLIGTNTSSYGVVHDASPVTDIGRAGDNSNYFNGALDDIKVYDYVRTAEQIAWSANQGKPVGHWKLNECQGGTAYDSGIGGNNGTITIGGSGSNTSLGTCSSGTGTEAWNNGTNGKYNASLDFDGTDDVISKSSPIAIPSGQSARTISLWIKPDNYDPGGNLVHFGDGGGGGQEFILSNDTIGGSTYLFTDGINVNNNIIMTGSEIPPNGEWSHITFIFDGGTDWTYYLNGKLTKSGSFATTINTASTTILNIGDRTDSGGDNFPGQIDEVKIYGYALTQQQISKDYNEGAVRFNE